MKKYIKPFTFVDNPTSTNGVINPFIINNTYISSNCIRYEAFEPVYHSSVEIWKEVASLREIISNFIYLVSTKGNVRRYYISKPNSIEDVVLQVDKKYGHKYFRVITSTGHEKYIKVHHIVAETFLSRPSKNHVWVSHINKKKYDNRVENLKWLEKFTNTDTNSGKGVVVTDRVTGEVTKYCSITKVAKDFGISIGTVKRLCEKRRLKYGYYWRYGY